METTRATTGHAPSKPRQLLLSGALVLAFIAVASPAPASTWNPVASERLVKLPGAYLKRAIDNDFAGSSLAASIRDANAMIALKSQTLADLQDAIEQSEDDLKIELQHQFLAEKRAYLELVGEQQDLRRKQMQIRNRLYERLLAKLDRQRAAKTPQAEALIEQQVAARQRMESTLADVDLKIFRSPATKQSRYAKEYAKNVFAIERLAQAIQAHPMNEGSQIDGRPVTKRQYLRQLVSEMEADFQVIDQEETILGYMAKLVALDALALSDLLAEDPDLADLGEPEEDASISAAVDYFIAQ